MRRTIFLHYEEFGGLDYRVTLSDAILTQWLMKAERIKYDPARKMLARLKQNDPKSWITAFTDDERLYKYLKYRYEEEAYKKLFQKNTYAVCWLESNVLKFRKFATKESADRLFAEISKTRDVAMMHKCYNHEYRQNPIRRTPGASGIVKRFLEEICDNSIDTQRRQCMRRRGVKKCSRCSRFKVYGPAGCTIYTQMIDEGEDQ